MILTWLTNTTNAARLRLMQMVSGGAIEIEPQREWIEPVETRVALGLSEDAIVIGHHLPLSDARMYRFLLDVLVEAHHMDARVRLLLVADGVWRAAMDDQAASMGLRKLVTFAATGFDTERLLQAVDVLAFPLALEGLGSAIAQAANFGVPCVVSTDATMKGAQEWATTLLERAAQPRSVAAPPPVREASLERLSAVYRTT
jgi:hypothetical protein